MGVAAWILMIVFGLFAFLGWLKYWTSPVNIWHLILIMLWTVIAALSAGVIFGGLFQ
jgi:MFS superfamily sulfate permease-like transporter